MSPINRYQFRQLQDCEKVIFADPILKQVFQNILLNSLKFLDGEKDPQIQIETTESPEHITFTIADNGIGIPYQYKNIIFKSFT